MGVRDGDRLSIELDARGRLILERIDPDPLRQLADAGRGLWSDLEPVEHQRQLPMRQKVHEASGWPSTCSDVEWLVRSTSASPR